MAGICDRLNLVNANTRDRCATPKYAMKTRLDEKTEKKADDKKEWKRVTAEVWARDKNRCRLTKRTVKKTLELDPLRGECHHIEGRADQAVRFDRRNVVLLSLETHQKVERNELRIVGTRFFTVQGRTYINADCRVRFEKTS